MHAIAAACWRYHKINRTKIGGSFSIKSIAIARDDDDFVCACVLQRQQRHVQNFLIITIIIDAIITTYAVASLRQRYFRSSNCSRSMLIKCDTRFSRKKKRMASLHRTQHSSNEKLLKAKSHEICKD